MKENCTNPVVYEVFAGMCKILKEEGGVMYKEMAIDMDIEFSMFSKLLSGKRPITEKYGKKIFDYLSSSAFEVYEPMFLGYICQVLKISETSMLYNKLKAKTYEDLIRYLFYEFDMEEIREEVDLKRLFLFYLHKYFRQILEERSEECHGYKIIKDEQTRELEQQLELTPNSIIEVGQPTDHGWMCKICILVCPSCWHREADILKNPLFIENFRNCMVVRLREDRTEKLCTMDRAENVDGTLAEFEVFHTGRIYNNARELAEMIFKKVCID